MAENLRVGEMINSADEQIDNDTIEKYCMQNDTNNCSIYGGLYQWDELMSYTTTEGIQGICPDGWHIPSDQEIMELEVYLGMSQQDADITGFRGTNEGGKLKEAGFTHWTSPNTGATNESDQFPVIPGIITSVFRFRIAVSFKEIRPYQVKLKRVHTKDHLP